MAGAGEALRRAVTQLRGHRLTYTVATLVALGEAVAMLTLPLLQRAFYDRVLIGGETSVLGPVLLGMLVVVAVMVGAKGLATYLFAIVGEDVKLEVRARIAERALRVLPPAGGGNSSGALVSVATNDVNDMAELYRSVIGYGIVNLIWLLATLVVLAAMDLRLLLVAFPLLGLYAALPLLVTPALRRAGALVQQRTASLAGTLQEGFSGVRDIKAFGRVAWGVERQHRAGADLREVQLQRKRLEVATTGSSVVYWVSVVGISWYGALAVSQGRVSVGGLLALLMYFGQLQLPVSFLVGLNSRLQLGLAASDRVFAQLGGDAGAGAGAGRARLGSAASQGHRLKLAPGASMTVRELHVRYPDGVVGLDGVTLQADSQAFLAVVGETGSGKSTLLNVLLGLVQPTDGEVRLDAQALQDLTDEDLRWRVAVSSADGVLFDLSVADNVRFGRLDATEQEVQAALYAAAADEFVAALPDGADTSIGERGARLSTGQRQRLLLARAFVRRPALLLLDEATSGLDGPTERLVLDRLLDRPDRPTVLLVTHRLQPLERADRIFVLDKGRLVEQGDHATLFAHGGVYHRLCTRRERSEEPGAALLSGTD